MNVALLLDIFTSNWASASKKHPAKYFVEVYTFSLYRWAEGKGVYVDELKARESPKGDLKAWEFSINELKSRESSKGKLNDRESPIDEVKDRETPQASRNPGAS